ncbi:unnamed protein product, partial [Amoebophrya sp. A25]
DRGRADFLETGRLVASCELANAFENEDWTRTKVSLSHLLMCKIILMQPQSQP